MTVTSHMLNALHKLDDIRPSDVDPLRRHMAVRHGARHVPVADTQLGEEHRLLHPHYPSLDQDHIPTRHDIDLARRERPTILRLYQRHRTLLIHALTQSPLADDPLAQELSQLLRSHRTRYSRSPLPRNESA